MAVKCNKCSYERKETDKAPTWECPSCGVAYNKVGYIAGEYRKPPARPPFKEAFHFNPQWFFLGVLLLIVLNTRSIINYLADKGGSIDSEDGALIAEQGHEKKRSAPLTGTITVPVNAYAHHKSRWTVSAVEKRLSDASKYFGERCDIVFDVRKIAVGSVDGLYEVDRKRDAQFAYLNPDPYNSVFIIFTGEDLVGHRSGYARYVSSLHWYPTANTIYMFEYAIDKQNHLYASYDTVIHEFGHVLMAAGHNQTHRNFLSEHYDGMVITQDQCERMRMISSSIVSGDLKPTTF